VLAERGIGPERVVGGRGRHHLPGVGQRVTHDGEEARVVQLAPLGGGEHLGGDVERHGEPPGRLNGLST
jgi:hypothetical protein